MSKSEMVEKVKELINGWLVLRKLKLLAVNGVIVRLVR